LAHGKENKFIAEITKINERKIEKKVSIIDIR